MHSVIVFLSASGALLWTPTRAVRGLTMRHSADSCVTLSANCCIMPTARSLLNLSLFGRYSMLFSALELLAIEFIMATIGPLSPSAWMLACALPTNLAGNVKWNVAGIPGDSCRPIVAPMNNPNILFASNRHANLAFKLFDRWSIIFDLMSSPERTKSEKRFPSFDAVADTE